MSTKIKGSKKVRRDEPQEPSQDDHMEQPEAVHDNETMDETEDAPVVLEEDPAEDTSYLSLAKSMCNNSPQVRDSALDSFEAYLASRATLDDLNMRKVWKIIFYTFWMSDKLLTQQLLAERIGAIVHKLQPGMIVPFFRAGMINLANNWTRIDRWRMDKYRKLVRKMLVEIWTLILKDYLEIAKSKNVHMTKLGFSKHFKQFLRFFERDMPRLLGFANGFIYFFYELLGSTMETAFTRFTPKYESEAAERAACVEDAKTGAISLEYASNTTAIFPPKSYAAFIMATVSLQYRTNCDEQLRDHITKQFLAPLQIISNVMVAEARKFKQLALVWAKKGDRPVQEIPVPKVKKLRKKFRRPPVHYVPLPKIVWKESQLRREAAAERRAVQEKLAEFKLNPKEAPVYERTHMCGLAGTVIFNSKYLAEKAFAYAANPKHRISPDHRGDLYTLNSKFIKIYAKAKESGILRKVKDILPPSKPTKIELGIKRKTSMTEGDDDHDEEDFEGVEEDEDMEGLEEDEDMGGFEEDEDMEGFEEDEEDWPEYDEDEDMIQEEEDEEDGEEEEEEEVEEEQKSASNRREYLTMLEKQAAEIERLIAHRRAELEALKIQKSSNKSTPTPVLQLKAQQSKFGHAEEVKSQLQSSKQGSAALQQSSRPVPMKASTSSSSSLTPSSANSNGAKRSVSFSLAQNKVQQFDKDVPIQSPIPTKDLLAKSPVRPQLKIRR